MKHSLSKLWAALAMFLSLTTAHAQINTGSDGRDGAFTPTSSAVIDMADHPDGIYQYTSVNIPSGVTVTFKPNTKNTPVVWLIQGNCVVSGTISVAGSSGATLVPGKGGPGGYRGGNGGPNATAGFGPGGGAPGLYAASASHALVGNQYGSSPLPGTPYGNQFLLPLQGGSGGGGCTGMAGPGGGGGGGGGGALLIAAPDSIVLNGTITAEGGSGVSAGGYNQASGSGSGGAIRIITVRLEGKGSITAAGGPSISSSRGGNGFIRLDLFENAFNGSVQGEYTQGFQPIIIPAQGQGVQLAIQSVGGVGAPASPGGVLTNPDLVIPAQQSGTVPVVVECTNVPLNSDIIVVVRTATGTEITGVGLNNLGTMGSSTATVPLSILRGGGIIYAKCVVGVAQSLADQTPEKGESSSIAATGWTTDGERFAKMEVMAGFGQPSRMEYITESGKRYNVADR